jgi:hypothetical protein
MEAEDSSSQEKHSIQVQSIPSVRRFGQNVWYDVKLKNGKLGVVSSDELKKNNPHLLLEFWECS